MNQPNISSGVPLGVGKYNIFHLARLVAKILKAKAGTLKAGFEPFPTGPNPSFDNISADTLGYSPEALTTFLNDGHRTKAEVGQWFLDNCTKLSDDVVEQWNAIVVGSGAYAHPDKKQTKMLKEMGLTIVAPAGSAALLNDWEDGHDELNSLLAPPVADNAEPAAANTESAEPTGASTAETSTESTEPTVAQGEPALA